jgi:hypothetical protein
MLVLSAATDRYCNGSTAAEGAGAGAGERGGEGVPGNPAGRMRAGHPGRCVNNEIALLINTGTRLNH